MFRGSWKRVLAQTFIAGFALGSLYLLFVSLPGSSIDRTLALAKMHESSLERSLVALDLRQARFHAAQLQIIDPISAKYRALALKAELIRDIFTRPTLLQSLSGLNDVVRQIEQIESLLPTATSDPDVETVKAIIYWRMGPTKAHEYLAAQLCTEALGNLEAGKFVPTENHQFALSGLAKDCLRNYLSQPIAVGVFGEIKPEERRVTITQMRELVTNLDSIDSKAENLSQFSYTPLTYVTKYNSLVRDLGKRSTTKYFLMLEAQRQVHKASTAQREAEATAAADLQSADKQAAASTAKNTTGIAVEGRKNLAKELLAVWDSFEESLKSDQSIRGTSAPLAALLLNDAVQARALVYATDIPDHVAPLVSELPDANTRSGIAKRVFRVRIEESFAAAMLSPATLDLVDFQEFQRFETSEKGLKEFESKFFIFKSKLSPRGKPSEVVQAGFECAMAAARVSINDFETESRPYVELVLDDARKNSGGAEFFDNSEEAKKIRAQFEADLNSLLTLRTRDYL